MPRVRFSRFWLAVVFFASSALSVFGQTAAATVSGRVTDSNGGVLIGATLELTSVERGTVAMARTNQAGIYLFPSVQPGQYHLVAKNPGFKQGESKIWWSMLVAGWNRTSNLSSDRYKNRLRSRARKRWSTQFLLR